MTIDIQTLMTCFTASWNYSEDLADHAIHVDEGSDSMMWRSLEEPPLGDQLDGGL